MGKEPGCFKLDQGAGKCKAHGGGKRCKEPGCTNRAQVGMELCVTHNGGKKCTIENCLRSSIIGGLCRLHGAKNKSNIEKRPCSFEGCTRISSDAKNNLCTAHGGRKKCIHPGCTRGRRGASNLCIAHGGGRRCQEPGCTKHDAGRGKCKAHGGGRRCTVVGCNKSATGMGNKLFCISHGGGLRCKFPGCSTSARHGSVYCRYHKENLFKMQPNDPKKINARSQAFPQTKTDSAKGSIVEETLLKNTLVTAEALVTLASINREKNAFN